MKNIFDSIQIFAPKKNSFDLSHEKKLSMNMGDLIPIYQQEVLPGDTFKVSSEQLIRLAPLVAPMMHRVKCTTHYFFVPNRLLWNEWENFITGGEDGLQAPPFPKMAVTEGSKDQFLKGNLSDYMGIPIPTSDVITQNLDFSALPFRAYQHIYNEYYRDQNLEPKVAFDIGESPDATEKVELLKLRKRAWEKDYFTSALPFAQKGGEVQLPIESSFTPQYKETGIIIDSTTGLPMDSPTALATDKLNSGAGGAAGNMIFSDAAGTNPTDVHIQNLENDQQVDATTVTITELRKAARLQEWLEKNARAGSRYVEQLLHMFGVKSDDARLQRPEYLGGGSQPVVISEVLQTSTTGYEDSLESKTPQGNMAGHGISVGKSNTFNKSFKEHGIILGIMSVIPRTTYEQGINRSWLKFDKFDYYWPDFAHIGEQELINKELFHDWAAADAVNDETFGYQSRYAEYKYQQSSVHGDFRTGAAGEVNLSYWHMGRVFDQQPQLNSSFIQSDPTHRVFAVDDPTEHKLYVQIYNRVKALRPIPYFSNPKL